MKYILLLLLFCNLSYSQDLSKLDAKNGINKFKFGSSFETYKTNLEYIFSNEDGTKSYKYTGSDVNNFYDLLINKIIVVFYKSKLYAIYYYFDDSTEETEFATAQNITNLFGGPTSLNLHEKNGVSWSYIWKSTNVFLQYAEFIESSDLPKMTTITAYSRPIHQQILNDGF